MDGGMPEEDAQRFLPRLLMSSLRESGHHGAFNIELDACVASIDVSLFSAFADRIERTGRGAERLGATMRVVLDPAIGVIEALGGSIVSFGGDSLTALWPIDASGVSAVHAAASVLAVSEQSERSDTGLRLRAGLSAGRVELMDLAGAGDHRFLVPMGQPVTDAIRTQEAASMGAVGVTTDFVRLAPRGCVFAGRDNEDQVLVACHERPDVHARSAQVISEGDQYIGFDTNELSTEEIRPVSTVVVTAEVGRDSADLVALIDEVLADAGSRLHQVAVIGDSLTALGYFGLPGNAHRDDADRAVRAALALEKSVSSIRSRFGVGVGSGRTFCGPFGTPNAAVYAVLGTSVNRAARLASVAESAVAVDANTREAATRFGYTQEQMHRVRSLSEPLASFRPLKTALNVQGSGSVVTVLLGRNHELEQVAHQLGAASTGPASAVVIEGVSGVGKTALLREIEVAALREHMLVTTTKCDERDRVKPYAALRPILRHLAGLGAIGQAAEDHERLMDRFAEEVQDPGWLSLLNEPLGVALPRTPGTREMTSTDRQEVLQSMLLSLFKVEGSSEPNVLLIDDAHWLDRSSWVLVREALKRASRLVFIIAAQSEYADKEVSSLRAAFDAGQPHRQSGRYIRLHSLGPSDVATLAASELGVTAVPQLLAQQLHEMTDGHPLLVIELTRAWNARGFIKVDAHTVEIIAPDELSMLVSDSSVADAEDVPLRVQQLITARLDRLSAPDRRALQIAARLFRGDFSVEELTAVVDPEGTESEGLIGRLESLDELGVLRQRRPGRWDFDHRMTRVAASSLASDEEEASLHSLLCAWLKREPDPDYSRLAFHSLAAGEHTSAVEYLDAAGSVALLSGAPLEAVQHFETLLAVVEDVGYPGDISKTRLAHWEVQLAEAESASGRRPESEVRFRSALASLGHPLPTGVGIPARLAYEALRQFLHRRRWLKIKPVEPSSEEALALAQAARAAGLLGQVFYFEERLGSWFMTVLLSVNLSERIRDPGVAALGYSGLASVVGILQTLPGLGSLRNSVEFYLERARAKTLTNIYPDSATSVVDELRPAEDSHHHATADVAASVYRLSIGRRPEGGASAAIMDAENAVKLARGLGGFDAIAASLAVYSFAHLLGGRQDVANKAIDELGGIAEQTNNPQYLAWYCMLKVPIAHAMNDRPDVERAAVHLESAGLYEAADGVSQGVMRAARLMARMGDVDATAGEGSATMIDAANDALGHLGSTPVFLNFIAYDMVLSALATRHTAAGDEERRQLDRTRRKAFTKLKRYSRRQPFARGLLALHQGLATELEDNTGAAVRLFTKALDEASESELQFIRGRALAGLARCTEGDVAEGHRAEAKSVLLENGATLYLEQLNSDSEAA